MTPPKYITKGKWEADFTTIKCDDRQVAMVRGYIASDRENAANARLMAASKALAAKLAKVLETKAVLNTAIHHSFSFLNETEPGGLETAIEAHEAALAEAKAELLNAGYTD